MVKANVSKGLNSITNMAKNLVSSKENVAILVLSLILVGLVIHYYRIKENYGEDIKIVLFHVSWCGYCKQFLPEWKNLGSSITLNNGQAVQVVDEQCDAEGNEDAPKNYGVADRIEGYPTVILFKGDKKIDYPGARNSDAINSWVNEQCK